MLSIGQGDSRRGPRAQSTSGEPMNSRILVYTFVTCLAAASGAASRICSAFRLPLTPNGFCVSDRVAFSAAVETLLAKRYQRFRGGWNAKFYQAPARCVASRAGIGGTPPPGRSQDHGQGRPPAVGRRRLIRHTGCEPLHACPATASAARDSQTFRIGTTSAPLRSLSR